MLFNLTQVAVSFDAYVKPKAFTSYFRRSATATATVAPTMGLSPIERSLLLQFYSPKVLLC